MCASIIGGKHCICASAPVSSASGDGSPAAEDSHPNLHRRYLGLTSLFALFYFMQGICEPTDGLLSQPVMALLKSWRWDSQQISTFLGLVGLPWAVKPLYGLLTDFVPIAGYRRKIYLIASSGAAAAAMLGLAAWLPASDEWRLLFGLLLVCSIGVAFSDVAIDALMVETAQPLGLTGRFQSVQWGAIYGAGVLTAMAGGYLSEHMQQRDGFLIGGGLALLTSLLAIFAVREARLRPTDRKRVTPSSRPNFASGWREAWRTRGLFAGGGFLFLWTFNPFSTTVLYTHATEVLNFREQFFGNAVALNAAAQMVASIAYGFYCRRFKMATLIHASIVLGMLSTLGYWAMVGPRSALAISLAVGVTSATATMIQLDLAARICPLPLAGTVFALLMALSNAGTGLSMILGGYCYEHWSPALGRIGAFNLLVGVGAAFTAGCWIFVPALKRAMEHQPVPPEQS